MTTLIPVANHSTGDLVADALLFGAPVFALAVLLWVWHRRDRGRED